MAQVFPFRAFRYNAAHVSFERVLTQPYDKISPAMQEKYYAADPHNLIVVEKGRPYPADTPQNNVYTRSPLRRPTASSSFATPKLTPASSSCSIPIPSAGLTTCSQKQNPPLLL